MTLDCFAADGTGARPIAVVAVGELDAWIEAQPAQQRRWLETLRPEREPGTVLLLPGAEGEVATALLLTGERPRFADAAALHARLPAGTWRLADPRGRLAPAEVAYAWALAAYRFERYRKQAKPAPQLHLEPDPAVERARELARAVWLARDLVNTPANDMGPDELQAAVEAEAAAFGARADAIVGEALLARNYPTIHAVGRASPRAPRLLELVWGEADAPKLTLVGKGVCFDTGGLDIKPSAAMLNMKKDMGGAALTLALARAVMALALPVRLRLLIPAVENVIAGSAFRPGDILRTRKGLTVEIGNTDAEGRLVLADALAEADVETPALLLDAATLTGAARVALGPELPALFTPDDALAAELLAAGERHGEPLWRLPLHPPYRKLLESRIADLNNTGSKPFAGAITAALFLQAFVTATRSWAHLDIFAWNDETAPGRPRGGEASAFRALIEAIAGRFGAGTA